MVVQDVARDAHPFGERGVAAELAQPPVQAAGGGEQGGRKSASRPVRVYPTRRSASANESPAPPIRRRWARKIAILYYYLYGAETTKSGRISTQAATKQRRIGRRFGGSTRFPPSNRKYQSVLRRLNRGGRGGFGPGGRSGHTMRPRTEKDSAC